jgi:hypothetical protein
LQAIYGPPSQSGFDSAVFDEWIQPETELEAIAPCTINTLLADAGNEYAIAGLSNARIVTVPLTNHDTTRSQCAKGYSHTFFLYSNAALDTACVEDFRPVFILPDAPLPAMGKAQSKTIADAY